MSHVVIAQKYDVNFVDAPQWPTGCHADYLLDIMETLTAEVEGCEDIRSYYNDGGDILELDRYTVSDVAEGVINTSSVPGAKELCADLIRLSDPSIGYIRIEISQ